ncbi:MAG TPA: HAD family phosphatase [Vicinamibacterales bacterium]|nr:HAD family phosphatase [Vicinamibacterales bacterium]
MKLPRQPAAVVFDMDGLLFDTENLVREAMSAAAPRLGFEMPEAVFLSLLGLGGNASRARLLEHYGEKFDIEAFWTAVDEDFHRISEGRQYLKTGVVELLDWLDDVKLPRAIATSSPHRHVQKNLATHGLSGRFDVIVAHGDYEHGKPHPAPFLKAAEKLGVAPEDCLALEDSYNGVRSACAAGMMTVMVPDLLSPTDDIRAICLHVALDLHEVRERLTAAHE